MEDICSPFSLGYFYQEEGMEDLRHSLLYTTIEFETTIMSAKEEITKRELEVIRLKDLLSRTEKERDEAQEKCKNLLQENQKLKQQLDQMQQQKQQRKQHIQQEAAMVTNEDDSKGSNSDKNSASTDCKENIITSPYVDTFSALPEAALKLAANRPLPEKGKLLQAVMEAGPLLQTLLLAGPLPQWQHPPPQLDSTEIPPVAISSVSPKARLVRQDSFSCININVSCVGKKRTLVASDGLDSSPSSKCQKVVLH